MMADSDFVEERVREFVADAADLPVADVGIDDNLYEDLGVDSLGAMSIFVDLSYEFGIAEPKSEEVEQVDTPRKLVAFVLAPALS